MAVLFRIFEIESSVEAIDAILADKSMEFGVAHVNAAESGSIFKSGGAAVA